MVSLSNHHAEVPLLGLTVFRQSCNNLLRRVKRVPGYQSTRNRTNTNALNQMLKRVQHDKKKSVIPNLVRNLEFGNDHK
jgi:hypothetical protein